MATNSEVMLNWAFRKKAEPNKEILELLCEGEQVLQCYETVRDQAILTDKRIIIRDSQGLLGKKVEIYSLPYKSIDMWSTENAGTFDFDSELELWTKAGHFKIKLSAKCDIREFDKILSRSILNSK